MDGSCQGKIGIQNTNCHIFVAVTSIHIDRFGVSQVFGVGSGQVFSSDLIVILQPYQKKTH